MNHQPAPLEPYPFPTASMFLAMCQTPPGNDAPPPRRRIRFGVLKGQIWVADDFDAPLCAGVSSPARRPHTTQPASLPVPGTAVLLTFTP